MGKYLGGVREGIDRAGGLGAPASKPGDGPPSVREREAATAAQTAEIEAAVRREISPKPEFLLHLADVRRRLTERAESAARGISSPMVRCLIAGSAARGGFLADRVDIDLFLLFPPELPREELERHGLSLARAILPQHETRYAEHPYLRGSFEGFRVDAVPGYAVARGARPQSAVDRTPFHQEYLSERETPELLDQIRLAKQFLRCLGVYGSEARTAGFSGYLVELLVLRFGSLDGWLEAARSWRIPVLLEAPGRSPPGLPAEIGLVLADPVDPERNVATALSRQNLARFLLAARAFRARPARAAFEVPAARPWDRAGGLARVSERGTHVTVLTLPRPELVDDVLYPQLRRAERGLAESAVRLGFQVVGSGAGADAERLAIVLEVSQAALPSVRVRDGPPVAIDRAGSFLAKWAPQAAELLQGPYVRPDGSLAVETRRPERTIERVLSSELGQVPLGQDLRRLVARAGLHELAHADDRPALGFALEELFDKGLPAWVLAAAAPSPGR